MRKVLHLIFLMPYKIGNLNPSFTDDKTKAEELSDSLKFTQLIGDITGLQTQIVTV